MLSYQLSLRLPIVFASHPPIFSVRPCSCQVAFSKHSRRPEVRAFRPRSSQDVRVVWERCREDSGLAGCTPRFLPTALLVPQAQPRVSRWIVLRPSGNHHSAKTEAVRYVVTVEVTAYRDVNDSVLYLQEHTVTPTALNRELFQNAVSYSASGCPAILGGPQLRRVERDLSSPRSALAIKCDLGVPSV